MDEGRSFYEAEGCHGTQAFDQGGFDAFVAGRPQFLAMLDEQGIADEVTLAAVGQQVAAVAQWLHPAAHALDARQPCEEIPAGFHQPPSAGQHLLKMRVILGEMQDRITHHQVKIPCLEGHIGIDGRLDEVTVGQVRGEPRRQFPHPCQGG